MRVTDSIDFVSALLRDRTGVLLERQQIARIRTRIARLARHEAGGNLEQLFAAIRAQPRGRLETRLIDALLNNETWFFRDHAAFVALEENILPDLVARRPGDVQIWSAACASGQEPYSLAMLAASTFPSHLDRIEIHASDISTHMLARARAGTYSQLEVNRGLPARFLVRYFREHGMNWQILPGMRDRVRFRRVDLAHSLPSLPEFDLVLLRNYLIYVDDATRLAVLERVRRVLRPDGYLLLGGAEVLPRGCPGWERITFGNALAYRRT